MVRARAGVDGWSGAAGSGPPNRGRVMGLAWSTDACTPLLALTALPPPTHQPRSVDHVLVGERELDFAAEVAGNLAQANGDLGLADVLQQLVVVAIDVQDNVVV